MLELAVLGLLKERPMHGYQLSRELGDSLGGLWRVSYGSLYPTLRRLESDAAIESEAGDVRGARRKKVYRITPKGEQIFLELLQETPQDTQTEDARFRMRLAFFRYLPPETRIRLLERRRQALQERLATIAESSADGAQHRRLRTRADRTQPQRHGVGHHVARAADRCRAHQERPDRGTEAPPRGASWERGLKQRSGSPATGLKQRSGSPGAGSSSEAVAQRKERIS